MEELLKKQAEGFQRLVSAAGGDAQHAINYLMLDKLESLTRIQTEAIKDVEIEKVIVYDSGNGKGVSNFVSGLYGMVPQLNDFLGQSGMKLPNWLVDQSAEETKRLNGATPNGSAKNGTPKAPVEG